MEQMVKSASEKWPSEKCVTNASSQSQGFRVPTMSSSKAAEVPYELPWYVCFPFIDTRTHSIV